MKKILLAFPIFQALQPRPFYNFAEVLIAAGRQLDYLYGIYPMERQSLVSGMNALADFVIKDPSWEAVIVFDDDCFPPYDVIPRLLSRCFDDGHLFVAAGGVMRGYPFTTTAAKYFPEGITGIVGPDGSVGRLAGFDWMDDLPTELVDVDFCGVPAAIIHRTCFERLTPPWFADLDEDGVRVTHDVWFCRKLKAAGIPVKVDGTIRCGHLAEAPIITFENRASARSMPAPTVA